MSKFSSSTVDVGDVIEPRFLRAVSGDVTGVSAVINVPPTAPSSGGSINLCGGDGGSTGG